MAIRFAFLNKFLGSCSTRVSLTRFCHFWYSGRVFSIAVATVLSSGEPVRLRQAAKRDWMRQSVQKRTINENAVVTLGAVILFLELAGAGMLKIILDNLVAFAKIFP